MSILSESVFEVSGNFYKVTRIGYAAAGTTFLVDQNAVSVASILPATGAPAASLGASDGNFEKTVTLASGSADQTVTVITAHNGPPAGVKPASRA